MVLDVSSSLQLDEKTLDGIEEPMPQ